MSGETTETNPIAALTALVEKAITSAERAEKAAERAEDSAARAGLAADLAVKRQASIPPSPTPTNEQPKAEAPKEPARLAKAGESCTGNVGAKFTVAEACDQKDGHPTCIEHYLPVRNLDEGCGQGGCVLVYGCRAHGAEAIRADSIKAKVS